jgi:hypothetical protein
VAFGDLFLRDIREYREQLAAAGMVALFPATTWERFCFLDLQSPAP